MTPAPETIGYLVYVAAILVPGYGMGEAFGRWRDNESPVRRLGLSLGYGIALDTGVLAAKTSGLQLGSYRLAGLDPNVVYFLIFLGLALLAASYLKRKKFSPFGSITRLDVGVLVCTALIGGVVWLYFTKYPIFPIYYNPDFSASVGRPSGFIDGTSVAIPSALLDGAGYYLTAMVFLATSSTGFIPAEVGMSALVVLSPMLVYSVAEDLFADKRSALLASAIFAFTGIIWAQMIYIDGLYPNFVAVLLELLLLAVFLELSRAYRSRSLWLASLVVLVAAYFSHFTVMAVLGAFVLLTVFMALLRRQEFRGTLVATLVFVGPGAVGALAFWNLVGRAVRISYVSGTAQPLTTYLAQTLSFAPSLAYLAFDVRNDPGFVVMLALLGVALYKAFKSKDSSVLLPAIWFFGLLIAAPQNYAAWRFSLEAVLPLTLLAGYGLDKLLPNRRVRKQVRLRSGDPYRFKVLVVIVLFMTPMVATGWTSALTQSMTQGVEVTSQAQRQVDAAMQWMATNTSSSASFLAVTDPTFLYSNVQAGRNCTYEYFGNETRAVAYARASGIDYIVVTRYNVYFNSLDAAPNIFNQGLPWYTYHAVSNVTVAYTNSNVVVYRLD